MIYKEQDSGPTSYVAPDITGCQEANNEKQLLNLALYLLKVLKIMEKAKPSDSARQSLIIRAWPLLMILYLPHPLQKMPF